MDSDDLKAPERPWTLADRYKVAHEMAQSGYSRADIINRTQLTEFTVTCIINRHRPGTYNGLAKNTLG